jgi:hypothetical protein
MRTINVQISTFDTTNECWRYSTETWTVEDWNHEVIRKIKSPEGDVCTISPSSGHVFTWPNLRKRLGIGMVSGEGISVIGPCTV